jgi:mRNA interferase MazF
LAPVGRSDHILCQITSQAYGDPNSVPIADADFIQGGLLVASFARPGKLFTAHRSLVYRSMGRLNDVVLQGLLDAVCKLLRPSTG